jgi:HK97 family phage prohead protease
MIMDVKTVDVFVRSLPFEQEKNDDDTYGDGQTFSGYAAVFNSPTRIDSMWEGTFDEEIMPGAFEKSLRETTPVFQFDHGKHPLIGSIPLGVLTRAEEDAKGLYVEARLTDNWLIQPVRDAIAHGGINGMSFRFTVPDGGEIWTETKGEIPKRVLHQVAVRELGPVVFPAYSDTTAKVRSMLGLEVEQDDETGVSSTRGADRGESDGQALDVAVKAKLKREGNRLRFATRSQL